MAHLEHVGRMALDFLESGADENLTRVFMLLHDVDDWKLFPGKTDQSENAVKYLHAAGVSDTGIKVVCADLL